MGLVQPAEAAELTGDGRHLGPVLGGHGARGELVELGDGQHLGGLIGGDRSARGGGRESRGTGSEGYDGENALCFDHALTNG